MHVPNTAKLDALGQEVGKLKVSDAVPFCTPYPSGCVDDVVCDAATLLRSPGLEVMSECSVGSDDACYVAVIQLECPTEGLPRQ